MKCVKWKKSKVHRVSGYRPRVADCGVKIPKDKELETIAYADIKSNWYHNDNCLKCFP